MEDRWKENPKYHLERSSLHLRMCAGRGENDEVIRYSDTFFDTHPVVEHRNEWGKALLIVALGNCSPNTIMTIKVQCNVSSTWMIRNCLEQWQRGNTVGETLRAVLADRAKERRPARYGAFAIPYKCGKEDMLELFLLLEQYQIKYITGQHSKLIRRIRQVTQALIIVIFKAKLSERSGRRLRECLL
jgi:hypothetical protein